MRNGRVACLAALVFVGCSSAPSGTTSGVGGNATTVATGTTTGVGGAGGGAVTGSSMATTSVTSSATTGPGGSGAGGGVPAGQTRGLWVWQKAVVTDPAEEAKLLSFCAARAINTVFVESQTLVGNAQPALATFIDHAAQKGIAVELLFGNMKWALPEGHAAAEALAQAAVTFVSGLGGAPKPVGIHFDVEPYTLPEWQSDQEGTASAYLDLLASLQDKTNGSGLRLSADIAFWFDGVMVQRGGVQRPLSAWVIDTVDRAVLMDYRDTAAEIVAQSAVEVAYGAQKGRPVLLGVETLCGLDPPKITFCEEGVAALAQVLAEVDSHHAMNPGFGGFGIHDYQAYQALGP